jgi:phosphonate transport system substrate-binding protein
MRLPMKIALAIALLGWWTTPGAMVAQPATVRHARLYGIAGSRVLNHVNHNDAKAALKVWFDAVAQQRGFVLDSKVDVAESVAEIRERLQSHTVDLLVLDVADYLELESSRLMVPVLAHSRGVQGVAPYCYVLLVNPTSAATGISGLRGKNILVSSRNASNTGLVWMEVLLGKEKLGRAASFFGSIKIVDKPQACILPLFFGTMDGCVVDETNLNLAKELNPQLGRLRVLERSRPMIESIIAMPVEPLAYKKELIDAMLSLHLDPRGRQLLTVFKTDRLVPFQAAYLDAGRELWREYYRLPGSPANRAAGSAVAEGNPADRGKEKY